MSTSMPYPIQANTNRQTPQPPTLHWGIVLALSIVTFGLFYYVWALRQALFIKKLDPSKQGASAVLQISVSCALMLFAGILGVVNAMTIMRGGQPTDLSTVGIMMRSLQYLMLLLGTFVMRKVLVTSYGIQMNGVLTWLFGVFYIQYHMTRVAKLQLPLIAPNSASMQVAGQVAPTQFI